MKYSFLLYLLFVPILVFGQYSKDQLREMAYSHYRKVFLDKNINDDKTQQVHYLTNTGFNNKTPVSSQEINMIYNRSQSHLYSEEMEYHHDDKIAVILLKKPQKIILTKSIQERLFKQDRQKIGMLREGLFQGSDFELVDKKDDWINIKMVLPEADRKLNHIYAVFFGLNLKTGKIMKMYFDYDDKQDIDYIEVVIKNIEFDLPFKNISIKSLFFEGQWKLIAKYKNYELIKKDI